MYLSKYDIVKLVDISVAELEGLPLKIMSKPSYKDKLYNRVQEAAEPYKYREKPNLIKYLTYGKKNTHEYWDCLPVTRFTNYSNEQLRKLLNNC
jgi:hypothetical protein